MYRGVHVCVFGRLFVYLFLIVLSFRWNTDLPSIHPSIHRICTLKRLTTVYQRDATGFHQPPPDPNNIQLIDYTKARDVCVSVSVCVCVSVCVFVSLCVCMSL